jgi:signal peptidase I
MAADPGAEPGAQADGMAAAGRAPDGRSDASTDGSADGAAPAPGGSQSGEGSRADEGKTAGRGKHKRKRPFWRDLVVIVVAALLLTIVIKAFLLQVFSIPSGSMENTLLPGDRILVSKIVYRFRPIDRGDIVVFSGAGSWDPPATAPGNPLVRIWDDATSLVGIAGPDTDYIKRVIGIPGDHVVCCNAAGQITVNGVPLSESSYVYPGSVPSTLQFNITVPAGRLWVMGDNRSDSDDSRYRTNAPGGGTIPESAVVGRAFLIIWPFSRFGDLPIPNTFEQPALAAAAAGPAALAGSSAAAAAGLVWRRRRSRRQYPAGQRGATAPGGTPPATTAPDMSVPGRTGRGLSRRK